MTATIDPMHELFFVRLFAYSIIPLLLACAHLLLDRRARTPARRIEIFTVYLLAISVGASGLGGAFGHLFLSDLIAEGVGWPVGSPFQLEMGFADLALGILGIMAISRRDGFRTATIVAVTVLGVRRHHRTHDRHRRHRQPGARQHGAEPGQPARPRAPDCAGVARRPARHRRGGSRRRLLAPPGGDGGRHGGGRRGHWLRRGLRRRTRCCCGRSIGMLAGVGIGVLLNRRSSESTEELIPAAQLGVFGFTGGQFESATLADETSRSFLEKLGAL